MVKTNRELMIDLHVKDHKDMISKLLWRIGQTTKPITNYVVSYEHFEDSYFE